MGALFSNNCSSSLAGTLSTTATSVAVNPGDGLLFPALSVGDWFMATITKLVGGLPQREIVKVSARAGDVLTLVRAQEGTTALEFSAGDNIDLRITAAGLNSKFDKDGGILTGPVTINGVVTMSEQVTVAGALTVGGAVTMEGQALKGAVAQGGGDKVKVLAAGVNVIDYKDGKYQVWSPSPGAQTLTITNWPPAGVHGELWIEGVNLGAATITTVALDYLKPDGTYVTTTSMNANQGATLQASGTDNVLIWGRDGAPKRAKVAR